MTRANQHPPFENPNTLWAHIVVDEFARSGLRTACIAPGSRSTPLALEFARHPDIHVYSLLDERSAAYFALGIGLASGKPAALVCTSGTAAANFYPAIIEADYAGVPMLVLTADRPQELRGSGANQTVDQVKMYGGRVRMFVDAQLPELRPNGKTIRSLRTLACRAYATTVKTPPGPVHLNFPFRKPLEPFAVPGFEPPPKFWARPNNEPFTKISFANSASNDLRFPLPARGLILCGPRCPGGEFPAAVADLSSHSGYPIVADALSGMRFGPPARGAIILNPQSLKFFENPKASFPDLVLQFGATPTSSTALQFLESTPLETRRISVQADGGWCDEAHTLSDLIQADPAGFCRDITSDIPPGGAADPAWVEAIRRFEGRYWQAVEHAASQDYFEGLVLADVVASLPEKALLFVASSNPVRHLDEFAPATSKNLRVFSNRGASGIDGTISSALGAASSADDPLVLVTGDLAFYHDMNALLVLERAGVKATMVLINNNGGGIFRRLPIAEFEPPFSELFLTPHGLDFEPLGRMFGAGYKRVSTRNEFCVLLSEAIKADTSQIIEIQTDSAKHEQIRRMINRSLEAG